MRICRFGAPGQERPGIWLGDSEGREGQIFDVRALAYDIHDINRLFFERRGPERLAGLLTEERQSLVSSADVRLGPPVARPGKLICLGKNYQAHAREFGSEPPERPIYFNKATSAIVGPHDEIVLPEGEGEYDLEAELAVVIGRLTRNATEETASEAIAGYTVLNDVTDRVRQRSGEQWFQAKSYDTFAPLGPFLVTPDEVPDPAALRVFSKLDGQVLQDDTTASMIFSIPRIIADLSARMTLEPGDVIATGTPAGIGSRRDPPLTLHAGSQVEVGVQGLGLQRCPVVCPASADRIQVDIV